MARSVSTLLIAATLGLAGCTGVFFQPSPVMVRTPKDLGLAYEAVTLAPSQDVSLSAWFLPAVGVARGTVLFLHGNAENISTHIGAVHWMPAAGFNVFLLDYRGYGRSTGVPTLEGVQADIDAAVRHLLERPAVDKTRMVLFGQSLGGALAGWYAARGANRHVFKAVVLDSAFASYRDIAREKLALHWSTRWLKGPAGLTIDDDYSPVRVVGDISPTPLLLIVGGRDPIVPPHHGERLFAHAGAPKTLWQFPDAGHIASLNAPETRQRLADYLTRILAF